MRWTLVLATALALLAAACNGGDDTATNADLDEGAEAVEVSRPDDPATPAPADAGSDADATEEPRSGAAAAAIDVRTDHPVEPRPGRWAVGDAGFVEWDHTDGGLVLVEVTESEGWSARVDEDSADEIEVDFTQGSTEISFEVEIDDRGLEVDVHTDIEPADPGVYQLGRAGSVEFDVDGDRLRLVDVVVADGWQHQIDEESADEIELTLRRDHERWEVEVELDDGAVELEIDYRVRGQVR